MKTINIVSQFFDQYKNVGELLRVGNTISDCFDKSRGWKRFIPMSLLGYDVYSKIRKITKKTTDVSHILECKLFGEYCWEIDDQSLLSISTLTRFIVKDTKNISGMYKIDDGTFKPITKMSTQKTLIHYTPEKYEVVIEVSQSMNGINLHACYIGDFSGIWNEFKNDLAKRYISSLDLENNILMLSSKTGVTTVKKEHDSTFKHPELDGVINTITKRLEDNERYGILLAGLPGTGKTTFSYDVFKRIKTPIVLLSHEILNHSVDFPIIVSMLDSIGPCLLLLEDIDSNQLSTKGTLYGELLSILDGRNSGKNHVFIASMNNSSDVNKSLLRAGRFDKIVEFKPPKVKHEIEQIINCTVKHKLNHGVYRTIRYNKLTHAEITAVFKRCDDVKKFGKRDIVKVIKGFKKERKLLKKYK